MTGYSNTFPGIRETIPSAEEIRHERGLSEEAARAADAENASKRGLALALGIQPLIGAYLRSNVMLESWTLKGALISEDTPRCDANTEVSELLKSMTCLGLAMRTPEEQRLVKITYDRFVSSLRSTLEGLGYEVENEEVLGLCLTFKLREAPTGETCTASAT